jgi:type VI secretion system protein ImpG
MINAYYQRELERLRKLGAEFAKQYPALASMLSVEMADPDVERLLEGSAFLTGMVYEKLDDELPEVLYAMLHALAPHYLRPIPCMTLMAFSPKKALRESLLIKRGTIINSTPVEGTVCSFSTCRDIIIAPLSLDSAVFDLKGNKSGILRLSFKLRDMALDLLPAGSLHLSLTGSYADASNLFLLLHKGVQEMRLIPEGNGESLRLPPENFIPGGISPNEAILEYPRHAFGGFRHLQEYFAMPEQFCSFQISGLERWQNRGPGSSFILELLLTGPAEPLPAVSAENFRLFVTPAVNLYPVSGEPIVLDHSKPSYLVSAAASHKREHHWVHSVERVQGVIQGSSERRQYKPFLSINLSSESGLAYSITPRISPLSGNIEQWISVAYPPKSKLMPEILSLDLTCSNGALPERLRLGEINQPSSSSPELAEFTNLRPPTSVLNPPLGKGVLWRLLSHLYLNLLSVASPENLRAMLKLYIFSQTKDRAAVLANLKRVDAIESLEIEADSRFIRDRLLRGQKLKMSLQRDGFAGEGDMYIFGSVLNIFLASYAAINTYTKLLITDSLQQREYQWPARLGSRQLL